MATWRPEIHHIAVKEPSDLFPIAPYPGGFPAKSITRYTTKNSSGQWIIAYQAEQRKRLKAVLRPAINNRIISQAESSWLSVPENTPASASAKYRMLFDKKLLMKHGYVDHPSDLCFINISGLQLQAYSDHKLSEFINLISVSASDNNLPFEVFEAFPALEELELSLNNIITISITPNTFTTLIKLDLSCNNISNQTVATLGCLPQLKELHLTGNNIEKLPTEMSRPIEITTNEAEKRLQISFPQLEKLWLDDNHLTDMSTFAILAGLRKLKYLNLNYNQLYCIPRLKLLGRNTTNPHSENTKHSKGRRSSSTDPFPLLTTLSITDNMIVSADSLIACAVWPSLAELIITGNPIVKMNKGLPDLLKEELVEKENISIIRTTKKLVSNKNWISHKSKDFIKVSTTPPPTIPKKPILLALESSSTAPLEIEDDMSIGESLSEDSDTSLQSTTANDNNSPGVFLTQPQCDEQDNHEPNKPVATPIEPTHEGTKELPHLLLSIKDELKQRREKELKQFKDVPNKYKGFESLLVAEEDVEHDGPPLPADIHSSMKALRHALKHPLMLTNARKATESKKCSDTDVIQYLKKKPTREVYDDTPAVSARQQNVEALVDDLKMHEMIIEMNLADILKMKSKKRTTRKEQMETNKSVLEGERLLKELQEKYNKVCNTSLEALQTLETIQEMKSPAKLNKPIISLKK